MGSGNIYVGQASTTWPDSYTLSVNAAGTIEELGSDAAADLSAPNLYLRSTYGTGTLGTIEVNATESAELLAVEGGGIRILDTAGGLYVTNAQSTGPLTGNIALTASNGDLTVGNAVTNSGMVLTTSGSGDVALDNLLAGDYVQITSAGQIAETGSDLEPEIDAATIYLEARTGIGHGNVIEIATPELVQAQVTGTGKIQLANQSSLRVDYANTANGLISITARDGDLRADSVVAGGAGRNVTLAANAGNVLVGTVRAAGDQVLLNAAGSIQDLYPSGGAPIAAGTVRLTAGGDIGADDSIEINGSTLIATAGGDIDVHDVFDGLVVQSATSAAGDISVVADFGNLTALSVSAPGGDVLLSTSGHLYSRTVTALGDIQAYAQQSIQEYQVDLATNFKAPSVTLVAGTGIGQNNAIELSTALLLGHTTVGDINLLNSATQATQVTNLDTGAGSIVFDQIGNKPLTVQNFSATVDGTITNPGAAGNILVGQVTAPSVLVVHGGGRIAESVADPDTDLTAGGMFLTGADIDPLRIQAGDLYATATSANGGVELTDVGGGVNVQIAQTVDGLVTLTAEGGNMLAHIVNAGGAHDIILTTTGGGNINLGAVDATGDHITVNSAGNIEETPVDGSVDLTAHIVDMTAATGIGSLIYIEVSADQFSANSTTGSIAFESRSSNDVTATQLHTGAGHINVFNTTGHTFTVNQASNDDGTITLSNTGGNLVVNALNVTGPLAGDATLNTFGSGDVILPGTAQASNHFYVNAAGALYEPDTDATAGIIAPIQGLNAGGGIQQLDIVANELSAAVTGAGNEINIDDLSGGLVVHSATTTDGTINLTTTGGNLSLESVAVGGSGGANIASLTSGDILINDLTINNGAMVMTAAGAIKELGADAGADVTAYHVDFNAATGIGIGGVVELAIREFSAVTGTGAINLTNAAPDDTLLINAQTTVGAIAVIQTGGHSMGIFDASTTNGSITLRNDGTITTGSISAGGAGTITLAATGGTATEVYLADLRAPGDTITISSTGRIEETGVNDAAADVRAAVVTITAGKSIGELDAIEVDATTLTASSGSTGQLNIQDTAGGVTVTATTAGGQLNLSAIGGNLSVTNATAGGGNNVSLSTLTSGDILVNQVSSTGTITLNSAGSIQELGSDTTADISAPTMSLSAVTGIGTAGKPEINATNLTANVTGIGGIDLLDTAGGLTVTSANTADGAIALTAAGGNLSVETLVANGTARNVTLTTTGTGNVLVKSATAAADTITINSVGSILESGSDVNADLASGNIVLTAVTGIGTGNTLEVNSANLSANVTGTGIIDLLDTSGGLIVDAATTADGTINLSASSALTLTTVTAGGTAANVNASTTTSGGIKVGAVTAAGDTITLVSMGNITEVTQDAPVDLTAATLSLSSVTGIGTDGSIEIDATTLTASASGVGLIDLNDAAGGLTVSSATTSNGSITLAAAGGNLTANTVTASGAGASVNLTTTTSGNLLVDDLVATGAINLTSAGNVSETGVDAGNDLIAGANSTIRANGGTIATADALEVQITNATLSVLATAQSGGVSVRINGTVSPTNTLIKLNTPPGSVLFNGTPVP